MSVPALFAMNVQLRWPPPPTAARGEGVYSTTCRARTSSSEPPRPTHSRARVFFQVQDEAIPHPERHDVPVVGPGESDRRHVRAPGLRAMTGHRATGKEQEQDAEGGNTANHQAERGPGVSSRNRPEHGVLRSLPAMGWAALRQLSRSSGCPSGPWVLRRHAGVLSVWLQQAVELDAIVHQRDLTRDRAFTAGSRLGAFRGERAPEDPRRPT